MPLMYVSLSISRSWFLGGLLLCFVCLSSCLLCPFLSPPDCGLKSGTPLPPMHPGLLFLPSLPRCLWNYLAACLLAPSLWMDILGTLRGLSFSLHFTSQGKVHRSWTRAKAPPSPAKRWKELWGRRRLFPPVRSGLRRAFGEDPPSLYFLSLFLSSGLWGLLRAHVRPQLLWVPLERLDKPHFLRGVILEGECPGTGNESAKPRIHGVIGRVLERNGMAPAARRKGFSRATIGIECQLGIVRKELSAPSRKEENHA